jgi:hypothetical protein
MESRQAGDSAIRRRRQCFKCGHRFTTIELEPAIPNNANSRRMGDYVLIEKVELNRIRRIVRNQARVMGAIAERMDA